MHIRILITLMSLPLMMEVVLGGEPDAPTMMKKEMGDISEVAHRDPAICVPDGIGVGGYDLISYREPGGPKPGNDEFAVKHGEFTYLFINAKNRDLFLNKPDRYLPNYGGWCAISLALGRLTCPDFTNFKIEDGELLLFETTGFTDGRVLWNTDVPGFRAKANNNYSLLPNQK